MAFKNEERNSGFINVGAIQRQMADGRFDALVEEVKSWTPEERVNAGRNTIVSLIQHMDVDSENFVSLLVGFIEYATRLACSGLEEVSDGRKNEVADYFQALGGEFQNFVLENSPDFFDYKKLDDNRYRFLVEVFLCSTLEPFLPAGAEYINILFTHMLLVACADTVNEKGIQAIKKLRADYLDYVPKKKAGTVQEFQGTYDKSMFES